MNRLINWSKLTTILFLLSFQGLCAADRHPVTGVALLADAEQILIRPLGTDVEAIDPHLMSDEVSFSIAIDLFEGLMGQDDHGNAIPAVATHYELSDDRLTYTFFLRPQARWSNGDKLTAHDFEYSWRRAVAPETGSPYGWFFEVMGVTDAQEVLAGDVLPEKLGARALDDHRFQVTLLRPAPYFPSMLATPVTFLVPKAVVEAYGADWIRPDTIVSNGAFTLSSMKRGELFELARNESYWNAESTLLRQVKRPVIVDSDKMVIEYKAGNVDVSLIPTGRLNDFRSDFPGQIKTHASLCNFHLMFGFGDQSTAWTQDVRLRQALSYAIDREVLVKKAIGEQHHPVATLVPEEIAGYRRPYLQIDSLSQAQRDAIALKLMQAAGYGVDKTLDIKVYFPAGDDLDMIAVLQQMWQTKLPVRVEMIREEWQLFMQRKENGDFDLAWSGWCGDYNEASTFLGLFVSDSFYNAGQWHNSEYDDLMQQSLTVVEPSAYYTRAEALLLEDHAIIPYAVRGGALLVNGNVGGWNDNSLMGLQPSKSLYKIKTPEGLLIAQ